LTEVSVLFALVFDDSGKELLLLRVPLIVHGLDELDGRGELHPPVLVFSA
jgi:hypothetical protein